MILYNLNMQIDLAIHNLISNPKYNAKKEIWRKTRIYEEISSDRVFSFSN